MLQLLPCGIFLEITPGWGCHGLDWLSIKAKGAHGLFGAAPGGLLRQGGKLC
jgi:hypothetical protein